MTYLPEEITERNADGQYLQDGQPRLPAFARGWNAAINATRHLTAGGDDIKSNGAGYVLVEIPRFPSAQCLESMAMRYHHGFSFLKPAQQRSILRTMAKLYEEASGMGFYSHTEEDRKRRSCVNMHNYVPAMRRTEPMQDIAHQVIEGMGLRAAGKK